MAKQTLPIATEVKETKADEARERRWRAEDALRDIERAEAHKSNKELMRDVKKCAKEKMKGLGKIVGK